MSAALYNKSANWKPPVRFLKTVSKPALRGSAVFENIEVWETSE